MADLDPDFLSAFKYLPNACKKEGVVWAKEIYCGDYFVVYACGSVKIYADDVLADSLTLTNAELVPMFVKIIDMWYHSEMLEYDQQNGPLWQDVWEIIEKVVKIFNDESNHF